MANPKPPPDLRGNERLGRRVFSRRQTRGTRARWRAFYDWKADSLSVDRLDRAGPAVLAARAQRAATSRETKRQFYGWLAVLVAMARLEGRAVRATPQPDNPSHADIDLPGTPTTDEERKRRARQHAQLLAERASLVRPPTDDSSPNARVRGPLSGNRQD